ncbi:hypothetical protein V8C86DRAFT_2872607 [Haematococcus lacustris]
MSAVESMWSPCLHSPGLLNHCLAEAKAQARLAHSSITQWQVSQALRAMGLQCQAEVLLPPDQLFSVDLLVDGVAHWGQGQQLALEVDGPLHYYHPAPDSAAPGYTSQTRPSKPPTQTSSNQWSSPGPNGVASLPLGATLARRRLLRGCHPELRFATVRVDEWHDMASEGGAAAGAGKGAGAGVAAAGTGAPGVGQQVAQGGAEDAEPGGGSGGGKEATQQKRKSAARQEYLWRVILGAE